MTFGVCGANPVKSIDTTKDPALVSLPAKLSETSDSITREWHVVDEHDRPGYIARGRTRRATPRARSRPLGRTTLPKKYRESWRRAFRRDWQLYALAVLPLLFFLIFRYIPMLGNVIAFRKFQPGGSMFGEEWVGLRYIQMFLNDPTFWKVFTNTVILGGLTLLISFPMPIILALLLNELRSKKFKKFVQIGADLLHLSCPSSSWPA